MMRRFLCIIVLFFPLLTRAGVDPLAVPADSSVIDSDSTSQIVHGSNDRLIKTAEYALLHGSIGAATAFGTYYLLNVNGTIHDELGVGFMAMPIIGGAAGLISGTIYGLTRDYPAGQKTSQVEPEPESRSSLDLEIGAGSALSLKKFSANVSLIKRNDSVPRRPDFYSLDAEYVRWNGSVNDADEFKFGIGGRNYLGSASGINVFYGFGAGISIGKFWNNTDRIWLLSGRRGWEKHSFVSMNAHVTVGIRFVLSASVPIHTFLVYEPVDARSEIDPGGFGAIERVSLKLSAGF
ncbi:MAG: hypothetical protein ACOYNS_04450 [Bacteroidota bacterium]